MKREKNIEGEKERDKSERKKDVAKVREER